MNSNQTLNSKLNIDEPLKAIKVIDFFFFVLGLIDITAAGYYYLPQLRGIFLLEDAHCHRSCRFWTVYSRIMMTSFKQTRLLSCIVFLYERSMYPFHSSVTSQTHMPQLPPPHPASLPPNHVKTDPGTVYWDMTPARKKKKGILLWRRISPWIIFVPFRN